MLLLAVISHRISPPLQRKMALGSTYLLALGLLVALLIQPGEAAVDVWEGKNAECYEAQKLVDEVVYVKNTDMARNAVQRALDDDLPICVKSGGHSYTCNFAKPGCFQIDMSKMNSVDISEEGEGDAKRYFITMGPGALTRDLIKAAPEKEYTYVHGECYTVGVGGYILHGGIHFQFASELYGLAGQNVVELEVVQATGANQAVIQTITDPVTISYFTRAGSSFGLVTKIKMEIFRRKAPTAFLFPILGYKWSVDDALEIWEKLWDVKLTDPEFQVGFLLQTNGLLPPGLQIAYLPENDDKDGGFQRCIDFINDKLDLDVSPFSKLVAKSFFVLQQTPIWKRYGLGLLFHLQLPPNSLVPYWKPEAYVGTQFVSKGQSSDLVREYFQLGQGNPRCISGAYPFTFENPWTGAEPFTIAGMECLGNSQSIAQEGQRILMDKFAGQYNMYYNGPNVEEDKCIYWPDYVDLANFKATFDPNNRFDVFQGINLDGACT